MKSVKFLDSRISPARDNSRRQRGVTLIELMVALVVGLLVLGALIKVYVDMSSMYRFNEGLARVQENGRFALEFIRRDARKAGFWGCKSTFGTKTCNPNNLLNTNAGDVSGTEGGANNATDSVIFRGAFDSGTALNANMSSKTDLVTVVDSSIFSVGMPVVVADCEVADIFQVSSISTSGNTETLTPDFTAPATRLGKAYQAEDETGARYNDVRVWPARETEYCIGTGASGAPALLRIINKSTDQFGVTQTCTGDGQELVEGIENLQVLYGEDTDAAADGNGGDGVADRYVAWGAANLDADRIVSVRISLLVRSIENNLMTSPAPYTFNGTTTPPADRYLRKVFTTTITLRNVPRMDPDPDWEAEELSKSFSCPT